MKIWTWEEGQKANEALSYYKSLGITKRDLYGCADICKSHKDFMVVLDFDEYGNEWGLMIEKERVIPSGGQKWKRWLKSQEIVIVVANTL